MTYNNRFELESSLKPYSGLSLFLKPRPYYLNIRRVKESHPEDINEYSRPPKQFEFGFDSEPEKKIRLPRSNLEKIISPLVQKI